MPLNMISMFERYSDDNKCRAALVKLRWPEGVRCPECLSDKISHVEERHIYDCDSCRYQFSVLAGTMLHDTHLPLTKWFLATYIMCESRKGVSANQLKRMLGVSYKTAWYLCHRIRAAMKEVEPRKLTGVVEVDETYVGGRHHGACIEGRGDPKKGIVVGIRKRGGDLRFFTAADVKAGTLGKIIRENVCENVRLLVTDDFASYQSALQGPHWKDRHKAINHSSGKYVDGDIYTNTVESAFSLLKRGVIGTWHKVSLKHLQAYCDEMTWRFNNRKNDYLFRDTLMKLVTSKNVEYKELTGQTKAA
ncbi:MAG TPA: IS1595 family transposase [Terriglobales bacterium]